METKILTSLEYVNEIVDIHMQAFPGFFLTFLGEGFLKQLYKGFITHNGSNIIGTLKNGKIIGFLAYSENISQLYKYLLKKSISQFVFYSLKAFIKKPKIMFRLLRALTYSKISKRGEAYIEISSIGVLPEAKNKGVGTMLINALKETVDDGKYKYIKLETDKLNNGYANAFYIKNGFEIKDSYLTHEGRQMNEYYYYLKSGELVSAS